MVRREHADDGYTRDKTLDQALTALLDGITTESHEIQNDRHAVVFDCPTGPGASFRMRYELTDQEGRTFREYSQAACKRRRDFLATIWVRLYVQAGCQLESQR